MLKHIVIFNIFLEFIYSYNHLKSFRVSTEHSKKFNDIERNRSKYMKKRKLLHDQTILNYLTQPTCIQSYLEFLMFKEINNSFQIFKN